MRVSNHHKQTHHKNETPYENVFFLIFLNVHDQQQPKQGTSDATQNTGKLQISQRMESNMKISTITEHIQTWKTEFTYHGNETIYEKIIFFNEMKLWYFKGKNKISEELFTPATEARLISKLTDSFRDSARRILQLHENNGIIKTWSELVSYWKNNCINTINTESLKGIIVQWKPDTKLVYSQYWNDFEAVYNLILDNCSEDEKDQIKLIEYDQVKLVMARISNDHFDMWNNVQQDLFGTKITKVAQLKQGLQKLEERINNFYTTSKNKRNKDTTTNFGKSQINTLSLNEYKELNDGFTVNNRNNFHTGHLLLN